MENLELQPQTKLDKGQRIGVGLLLCITVLLVAVSIYQFNSNIFAYGKRIKTDPLLSLDSGARADAEQEALKKVDTDGDGLTDYDELFVYRSSPYMRDTDSDGTADGEEVRRGTSPTCQEGKDCLFNSIAATANASSTVATQKEIAPTANAQEARPQVDLTNVTAQELRDALIESGVPKDQLTGVSDDELMKLVQQAQSENKAAPATKP